MVGFEQQAEKVGECKYSQSPHLDKYDDHTFPKSGEGEAGIYYGQPCYGHSAGNGKYRINYADAIGSSSG